MNNNNKQISEIHFFCKKQLLQKALNVFQSILEKKSLIPIFSNIKIDIIDSQIVFSGMNIEIACKTSMNIINLQNNQNNSIAILVNGHIFYDIIRKINSDEITIKKNKDENFIEILSQNFYCKMSLQENEKFPHINTLDDEKCFFMDAKILYTSIESVLSCASINDSRSFLCAIKIIQSINNEIEFITTDSHRMAYIKWDNEDLQKIKINQEIDVLIPRKTASFILKFLKESYDKEISFKISNQKILFIFMDPKEDSLKTIIISKIQDAKYPNFRKLLNFNFNLKFNLKLNEIIDSVDRAMIFLDEKHSKILNLELKLNQNQIIIISQSDDKGFIKIEINNISFIKLNPEIINKENYILSINAYYFYDILKSMKSDIITFGFNQEKLPLYISDGNFLKKMYLLMPMSL